MSDWPTKRLGDVLQLNYGKSLPLKNRVEGAVPVYGSNGVVGSHNEPIVDKPGLVVGRKGSAGEVHFSRGPFCPIDTTFYVTKDDAPDTDLEFLFYLLRHVDLTRITGDVGVPGLNREMAYMEPVRLPASLPEQKKIAHILSTVQRAIEAQERIIQTTTELKKALMHKLFTEGLRHEPQKQTEIGPIPESWEVVKLGKHIQIAHGYAFKGEFFVTDGPTVLTPGNFKLDGGLYWGKRTKYTTENYEPNVVLKPGEMVVVMTDLTPTAKLLGGPAFIPEGRTILHNQRIGKVELKGSKTTLQFLYWVFLSEPFKRYMRQTATGSTVRHTSPSKIYQYAFGLPSLEEQAQAVDCLAKVDAKLANAEDKKRALEDLFRTLLHELMTAKTRVHDLEDGPSTIAQRV